MGTYYTFIFTPEEASKWMAYENNAELAIKENNQYEIYPETENGLKAYYVLNEKGEKVYNVWDKLKGDFVVFC